ncbi:hypothetical protein PISMIDRAFT_19337 [Pisolithus microcarpus 441]|uniref:Uncharacterized protein n=1 Tax=Pisolithus microcarpus 441 TaxID=765257 RepID=A0A0C9XH82_9AGAM|nr:hypothetical protein PISMIDRAFT_19337 [Pisolithus microcarpus 441]
MAFQHTDLENGGSGKASFERRNPFTVAAITSLYSSPFAEGFNVGQCQAAIQALLRYGAHEDGTHHHVKSPGGLHPAYAAFNPVDKTKGKIIRRTDLIEASLGDVFDAITLQDCLDSGLSVLVRCPGSDTISAEELAVDVYVTPHKILENERVCGDSTMLVQAFCQEFAVPHLQRFTEQCKTELIRAPKPCCADSITLSRLNHLPPSVNPDSSRILCAAFNPEAKPGAEEDEQHLSPSAAIRETIKFIPSIKKPQPPGTPAASLCQRSTCQRRPADAFLNAANTLSLDPTPLSISPDQSAPSSPLISIGPNTDAILDRFSLGDEVLPRLHVLVGTVRSSCWEVVLRAKPWNLTYEQASNLSRALLADIKGTPEFRIMMQTTYPTLSALLRILGVATLSGVLYILFLMVLNITGSYPLHPTVEYCRASGDLLPLLLMVIQTFYSSKSTAQRIQPKARPQIKVILSANACVALKLNQHDKAERFKKDLDDAWQSLDKVTKTLASKHHKSIQRVKNDLHLV